MSRQTSQPLDHISLNPTYRSAIGLVQLIDDGSLLLDPPYQRGDVWREDQRIALVQSWLRGLPPGVVILSDRGTEKWRRANGEDVYETGVGIWACIDGKQRLTTAIQWLDSQFAIPASWLSDDYVETTEDTADGPYVRYSGLSEVGGRFVDRYCSLLVAETKDCATEAEEAAFYLLVNGGGTVQTAANMANAARVAEGG
ncbi:DUF262 domain-containing protein [Streptomyces sp. NPDC054871]